MDVLRPAYDKLPRPTVVGRPHELACRRMWGRYFMQIDGDDYLAPGAPSSINIKRGLHKRNALATFKETDCVNNIPHSSDLPGMFFL